MNYNPRKKLIQITIKEADKVYTNFIYALRSIRHLAGLPLDKYEQEGPLTHVDFAQQGILQAARNLGIDMGAEWGNELDLREEG